MSKPQTTEYAPFYATYINKVGDGDIIDILKDQQQSTYNFFKSIAADKASYAYADGKWTIKQVLGHMIDTERIMTYRALRFARNDRNQLAGFDENDYVANAHHNDLELADLAEEFKLLREANLYFFKSLNTQELQRQGIASGHPINVNALIYIIAGHEQHHINIIKERYL